MRILGRHRFLDLEQQVSIGPHLVGGADQLGARRFEVRVGDCRAFPGAGLDQHLVAAMSQCGDAGRGDGDPNSLFLVSVGMPTRIPSVKKVRKKHKLLTIIL